MRDHVGHLTIDLGALVANWRALAARVAPAECAAVVKANAYGLGIEAVVPALIKAGCRTFFVAHLAEAKRVRALCVEGRIYVLNGFPLQAADEYLAHRLSPVLGTLEEARFWAGFRDHHHAAPLAALHIETGMNRLGITTETAKRLVIDGLVPHLGLDFVLSHFISAEEHENPLNPRQIADFTSAATMIRTAATLPSGHGVASGKVGLSLCNSAGIFLPHQPYGDLVRPGYALYGGNPTPGQPNPMQAVVRLDAPIMQIRAIKAGESVGYNAQWIAKRDSRIAVISCGYADGYLRGASNKPGNKGGSALVHGVLCPFAGRVSMDLITLDVTDLAHGAVHVGDSATLIGPGLDIDQVGAAAGSIGYEILTALGHRYERRYLFEESPNLGQK